VDDKNSTGVLMQSVLDGFEEPPVSVVSEWYQELGLDMGRLDKMLRTPTDTRPFVYEIRIDLWPASGNAGLVVLKGFGADGSIVAFQDGVGLLGLLRGVEGRLRAGKTRWKEDEYSPKNYGKRVAGYLADLEYKNAKHSSK